MFSKVVLILLLALISLSCCHLSHDHEDEIAKRSEFLKHNSRSLSSCALHLDSSDHGIGNTNRRREIVHELRREGGADLSADAQNIGFDNSTCLLQPEATEGPYYLNGEMIRQNVIDNEPGVQLILALQVIDTTTCKPLAETWVDIWHCNSTGVYGGIVADGNGDSSDASNLNVTALRGLQKTNDQGIVQFRTIFPGHYLGRTNHIHLLTHSQNTTTVNDGRTVTGLIASHVGQIYFEQSLQAKVEANEPYTKNKQALTTNDADSVLNVETTPSDSIIKHVLLGQDVTDGIFGWISVGIDPSIVRKVWDGSA